MDELDIHFWGNLFRNFESAIQPLLNLIIPTLQGLHGDQEERVGGGQGVHSRSREGHVTEEL